MIFFQIKMKLENQSMIVKVLKDSKKKFQIKFVSINLQNGPLYYVPCSQKRCVCMYMMYLPYKPLNLPHFSKNNYHIEKISSIQKILKSSKVGCFMCTMTREPIIYL